MEGELIAESFAAGVEMVTFGESAAPLVGAPVFTEASSAYIAGGNAMRATGYAAMLANPARAATGLVSAQLFPEMTAELTYAGEGFASSVMRSGAFRSVFAGGVLSEFGEGAAEVALTNLPLSAVTATEYALALTAFNSVRGHVRHADGHAFPVPGMDPIPIDPLNPIPGDDTLHNILITLEDAKPNMKTTFPKTARRKMKWSAPFSMVRPDAYTNQTVAIKLNSIVNIGEDADENSSGSTENNHEPLGYTQYSAIYDQYVVNGATVRVDYHNPYQHGNASDNDDPIIFGLALKDDFSLLTTPGYYEELDHTIWKVVGAEGIGTIVTKVDPVNFFGIPKRQALSESTLRSAFGGDPTNKLYLHVFHHPLYQAAADGAENTRVNFHVTIEYDVTWMEPKSVGQS